MPNYVAVAKETHNHLRWTQNNHFSFFAQDALCPLVMQESRNAAVHLPIVFSKLGDHYGLFALQSLEAGSNYLVDSDGHWLGDYIPAAYRGYPFALAEGDGEKLVLCIDSDSDLIGSTGDSVFFDDDGEPSVQIREKLHFLSQLSAFRKTTYAMCSLLEELGLLEPWSITIEKNGEEVPLEGLFRVNEKKFNALDAEALIGLRDKGALPLIFSQLLSMQNISRIAKLISNCAATTKPVKELSFDFPSDEGNISFDTL